MLYGRIRDALAFVSVWTTAGPIFFLVFWTWFDFWRERRAVTYSITGVILIASACLIVLLRAYTFGGRLDMPLGVVALGWVIIAAANALGFVADRQLGFWLRAFSPFFEAERHIKLRTTGAYGIVRHPIYVAGGLLQLGTFLLSGYPAVLAACVVWTLSAMWFTRREEEHIMAHLLDDPDEYVRYRLRVGALFPRLVRGGRTRPGSVG